MSSRSVVSKVDVVVGVFLSFIQECCSPPILLIWAPLNPGFMVLTTKTQSQMYHRVNVTNSTTWWSDALLQLHVQITQRVAAWNNFWTSFFFFFLQEWLSNSPLKCSGFTSQEAQEVKWAGRCDCIPACVDYMSLCVRIPACVCALQSKPTNKCCKPIREICVEMIVVGWKQSF